MKALLIFLIAIFLSVSQGFAFPPAADNLKNFNLVWQTVYQNHFDPTFGGRDWPAIGNRYRTRIAAASSLQEFQQASNDMLFELNLSHLLVASEEMLKKNMPALFSDGTVGIEVRWIQDKAVITNALPGFPGRAAGLKPGYVITGIDGRQVRELVRQARALPPFNARNRKGGIANLLRGHIDGPPGTPVALAYLGERSQSYETVMVRRSRGTGQVVSKAMPPVFIEFEARRMENDIGYIRFNHFAEPVDPAFLEALETLRDTRGLIFDVRGNPGGYFRVMDTIIEQLIDEETPLYQFRLRDATIQKTLTPSQKPYAKPVVVLMDVTSMSCSEHFAACLQAIGRAVIIGDRSPGYLLGAKWMRLPNGLSFMYTFLQPIPSSGLVVEDNGVTPDIEVTLDPEDLLKGHDGQLEAAIAYIIEKSKKSLDGDDL